MASRGGECRKAPQHIDSRSAPGAAVTSPGSSPRTRASFSRPGSTHRHIHARSYKPASPLHRPTPCPVQQHLLPQRDTSAHHTYTAAQVAGHAPLLLTREQDVGEEEERGSSVEELFPMNA